MSLSQSNFEVKKEHNLSVQDFHEKYLSKGEPVLITGIIPQFPAYEKWSLDYFGETMGDMEFGVKHFTTNSDGSTGIKTETKSMGEYTELLKKYDSLSKEEQKKTEFPPYCHDVPIFMLNPELIKDVAGFPVKYLPHFYQDSWEKYIQFFMSAEGSVTPLHFDCLVSNNLFFQFKGRKKFILAYEEDWEHSYRYNWRWCKVDAENPDFNEHPNYRNAKTAEIIVNPGELLFMPAGMLHYVRSLDSGISFNIDFHTPETVVDTIKKYHSEMPEPIFRYNSFLAMGLVNNIPSSSIYKHYQSYMTYVS